MSPATRRTPHSGRILGIASGKAKSTKKVKIKVVVVGARTVTLASGRHKIVTVSLNGIGRRLLARFHRLRVSLRITTGGNSQDLHQDRDPAQSEEAQAPQARVKPTAGVRPGPGALADAPHTRPRLASPRLASRSAGR